MAVQSFLLHWELRTAMTELDVEIILQRAWEKYPDTSPRIITDNGPQFIAKDFKEFIRLAGLTHVKTSPYYPQSNGKIERWHQSLKADCLRPGCPLSQQDAARLIERFVNHYNTVRLHSAIGYVTRPIGSPPATWTSSPSAIVNSNSLAKTAKLNDNP
jgi:putative transposase